MAQAKEGKRDKPAHRVLLYVQTAEDISILQDILAGIGAEGVVCTDLGDLCRQMAQDVDAVLLTEQSIADGALPILAEALQSQPEWSDLPVLFVAAGGVESPWRCRRCRNSAMWSSSTGPYASRRSPASCGWHRGCETSSVRFAIFCKSETGTSSACGSWRSCWKKTSRRRPRH